VVYPVELAWGSFRLPVHLLCEVLAYSLGYRLYTALRARTADRISDQGRQFIFIGAAAGALLGSRLLGLLEHPELLLHPPGGWLYYTTNKTIVGGFLGGLLGVELTKKRLGITASSGDLMVYPLLLGLAIGRLGCHFSGLEDGTFGTATRLPWGLDFGDGIARHPTVVPDLNQLLCCLPQVSAPNLSYENLFRVIILQFMDAWNFDVRAVKKSCVHIVSKDLKIIPFETMNIFYRDPEKLARLEELRNERVGII
jgi:prolipoprotein diacylglyceryltransferase